MSYPKTPKQPKPSKPHFPFVHFPGPISHSNERYQETHIIYVGFNLIRTNLVFVFWKNLGGLLRIRIKGIWIAHDNYSRG